MHTRTYNWLTVMLALALAVAPLRGAWAMPMPTSADSTTHCAQMDMSTGMQQQDDASEAGHACEQDCNDACCDGACNACAHGASTLADTVIITQQLHATPVDEMFMVSFPERTVIPPLRPPAFLP